jgi:hypothetical protein
MTRQEESGREGGLVSRRTLVGAMAVGATFAGSRGALAQAERAAPPSTVTSPPRDFGPNGAPTTYFRDPDVIAVDPLFNQYTQPNSAITRLWTGALWSEGPAWNAQGRYLVWSDIPNNRQLRWLEDNGQVSVFRMPSNHSNRNTFDFQGRQISCEHLSRRVVRYELDGSATVGQRRSAVPVGAWLVAYNQRFDRGSPLNLKHPADPANQVKFAAICGCELLEPGDKGRGSRRRPDSRLGPPHLRSAPAQPHTIRSKDPGFRPTKAGWRQRDRLASGVRAIRTLPPLSPGTSR